MIVVREKSRHECRLPPAYKHRNGTVWMCDDCGRFWVKRLGDRQTFGFQNGHWLRIRNPLRIRKLQREVTEHERLLG